MDAQRISLIDQTMNKIDIASSITTPVPFDIEPEHTELGTLLVKMIHCICNLQGVPDNLRKRFKKKRIGDLLSGITTTKTWENVSVNIRHTASPCIFDRLCTIWINVSDFFIDTNNSKVVIIVYINRRNDIPMIMQIQPYFSCIEMLILKQAAKHQHHM